MATSGEPALDSAFSNPLAMGKETRKHSDNERNGKNHRQ
jgi:hypothetical protein